MVAVYGNLMVTGIAVALFLATLNLGKRSASPEPPREATRLSATGPER